MFTISLLLCCASLVLCEPFAEPGGWSNGQAGGFGRGSSGWQGSNGNFGGGDWQRSQKQGQGFGAAPQNQWARSGGNGGSGSFPSNSYNTPQKYGYDYKIPGADVHFASFRNGGNGGSGGGSGGGGNFGRSSQFGNKPWQSQGSAGNAWPQKQAAGNSWQQGGGGGSGGGNGWSNQNSKGW